MRSKILQLEESTLHLERNSRNLNLRFGGIPELEHETPFYPYDIHNKGNSYDKCDLQPEMVYFWYSDKSFKKSGIHNKLDTVISNQQSLLSRMATIEDKHPELEKSVVFTSQAVDDYAEWEHSIIN